MIVFIKIGNLLININHITSFNYENFSEILRINMVNENSSLMFSGLQGRKVYDGMVELLKNLPTDKSIIELGL